MPERKGWWAGPLPTVVLPLAVGAFSVVGTFGASRGQPFARPLDALGIALLLAGAAALVLRRRYPAEVLAATEDPEGDPEPDNPLVEEVAMRPSRDRAPRERGTR